jgi:hypothetical protein
MKKHENIEGRLTGQRDRWAGRVGGQARKHPVAVRGTAGGEARRRWRRRRPGDGVHRRGRHRTGRGRQTRAAAGGAGRVVRLGLVVNGSAGRGNREKLIFGGPLGFRWLIN